MRISSRLTLAFALAAVLAVLLAGLFFFKTSVLVVERQYRDMLRDTGAMLEPRVKQLLLGPHEVLDADVDLMASGLTVRLTLIDPEGRVLGDSQRSGADLAAMENHAGRPEVRQSLEGQVGYNVRTSATLGVRFLYAARAVRDQGRYLGTLRLAVPLTSVRELEDLRLRYVASGIVAVLAAALLLAAALNTWFSRPMAGLQTAARAIAEGQFNTQIPHLGPGELDELGHTVQRIADSLRQTITRLESDRGMQSQVFSSLQEGVIAVDAGGTIVLANEAAMRQLGESSPLVERDVFELFRQPNVTAVLSGVLDERQPGTTDITLEGPPERILKVAALPVAASAGALVAVLVLTDVTTLVSTLRMRRDFFSNASHELRTPLTSILGYLETLEDQLPSDSPLRRQYLDVLVRQAERMRRIIDDLLMLAQVESAQWPVEKERYDIAAQTGQILDSFKPAAEKSGQSLLLVSPVDRILVHADREKIHVVLSNLLDNALKYAGDGATVQVKLEPGDQTVLVSVIDDGPGIPRTETQRVFERFYRLDKSRSRQLGGTGLGLSIVRNILAAHESEIHVESELGEGARFRFELPLAQG